ncbi:MAG: hypothetical protein L7V87_00955 [Verrucomicrobiales bacterium]|nr:hypothetical protein [Verrucomicrobiales bacterium]
MKFFSCLLAFFSCSLTLAEEKAGKSNLPPDPFSELGEIVSAPDYPVEVDRTRGSFVIDAEEGKYQPGSHFANWFWTMKAERWGNYFVGLLYESARPKLGIQVKIGEEVLKSYASRTSKRSMHEPMILGTAYIPKPGDYPVMMLTGDQSNVPAFQVKGLKFIPAPENEILGQSIDGEIVLEAKTATTYSEMMRYEPKPEKNCLGFWIYQEDWAEWIFDVSTAGEFDVTVTYGCGNGNEGSEVAIFVNDQTRKFTVEDTGGFQSWKEITLEKVKLDVEGKNKIAIIPQSKAKKAVMDIQKIVLTPAS